MNKADWDTVKTAWGAFYDQVNLVADGHLIALQTQRNGMSMLMVIYVDGFIKGEYMNNDNEIGKKFYFERKIPVYKPTELKAFAKIYGKRHKRAQQTYVSTLSPYWKSFAAFKKHLNTTCKSLELLKNTASHITF